MNNFTIIAYYTKDTYYKDLAESLTASCKKFNLDYIIQEIPNLGTWQKNTHYKPIFIHNMLKKDVEAVVYVDVDAVFMENPLRFNAIQKDIAIPILDHVKHGKVKRGKELLSGTLYFKNTIYSKQLINKWCEECVENPNMWDQRVLEKIVSGFDYEILPDEYCYIFDYKYKQIGSPVITHYQASRRFRKTKSLA